MEITIKDIQAIVYQYCYQPYRYTNEFGTFKGVVGDFHTNTHMANPTFKLVLKSLASITDEDAIEVAKIENVTNFEIERKPTYIRIGKQSYGEYTVDIYFPDFDLSQWDNGWTYGDNETSKLSYKCYQYLQSKGYDLPHYLLGGKTLHEAGLAVYENEK